MKFDVYFDHMVQHKRLTEVMKTSTKNTKFWAVRVGKFTVSLETLKPERKSNHGKPTESRGRTKPDD